MSAPAKETVYERITGNIINALEHGVAPWTRPWAVSLPHNAVTGRHYNGVNILGCLAHQLQHGYTCSGYLTFQQAKTLGGYIRQGERGVLLVLYRDVVVPGLEDDEPCERHLFLAKGFTVFNLEQTGGLEHVRERWERTSGRAFEPIQECERVVLSTGADLRENGTGASYSPTHDRITMPPRSTFRSAEDWYATLYHEMVHWSGATHRLNRHRGSVFGSRTYAMEELVAELGACFLAARCGIEHMSRSASYIDTWLDALQRDTRFIFAAAKHASDASRFIYPEPEPQTAAVFEG